MPDHVRDVVERSRLGDQNPTAIIACVRVRAESGHPKAKASHQAIVKYIKENPPGGRGQIVGVFTSMRSALGRLRDGAKQCKSPEEYASMVPVGVPRVGRS